MMRLKLWSSRAEGGDVHTNSHPPKWLVDQMPDTAIDVDGNPRKFGSRRHYSFAHQGFGKESQRITKLIASVMV